MGVVRSWWRYGGIAESRFEESMIIFLSQESELHWKRRMTARERERDVF
jgi:hypothetical protein